MWVSFSCRFLVLASLFLGLPSPGRASSSPEQGESSKVPNRIDTRRLEFSHLRSNQNRGSLNGSKKDDVVSSAFGFENLVGSYWLGSIDGTNLRLLMRFLKNPYDESDTVAHIYSLDQGGDLIPASALKVKEKLLEIEVALVGGIYIATVDVEGTTMTGTWTQGSFSRSLVLDRFDDPPSEYIFLLKTIVTYIHIETQHPNREEAATGVLDDMVGYWSSSVDGTPIVVEIEAIAGGVVEPKLHVYGEAASPWSTKSLVVTHTSPDENPMVKLAIDSAFALDNFIFQGEVEEARKSIIGSLQNEEGEYASITFTWSKDWPLVRATVVQA